MVNPPVLPATLPFTLGIAAELTYFTIQGFYGDVENPSGLGSSTQPTFPGVISATVTFFPRVPTGTALFLPDLDMQNGTTQDMAVPLAPIQGRIINGVLQTINRADTPDVQLLAYTSLIATAMAQQGLITPLVYDVQFSNVTFAGGPQVINNFAFNAPTIATTITLTDPLLERTAYAGPSVPFVLP
jgi:hypothetical protein